MTTIRDKKPTLKIFLLFTVGAGLFLGVYWWLKQRLSKTTPGTIEPKSRFSPVATGLSLAEVQARQSDVRVQARLLVEQKIRKDQLKRRIFTIFNLTMLVMSITQFFFRDFWGVLATLGTLLLNILITVFHQTRSSNQVGKLLSAARPKATALREGMLSNIDQDEIVIGDVLVAGKGDEIFADGTVLESADLQIDLTPLEPQPTIAEKNHGDRLQAGSYCQEGWGIYRVELIPDQIDEDQISVKATPISEVRTPLQKGIQIMLQVLLVLAGLFYAILVIEFFRLEYIPSELILIYRQAISIIFSIAPSGLLFMVIINYAVGSANIANAGALIRSSDTIEDLAQVSVFSLVRKNNLNSLSLQIIMIPDEQGAFPVVESRARQLLGNYFHSVPTGQFPFFIIQDNLEGNRYKVTRDARFFSVLGWEAVNFESEDMPGSYVVGYPQFLQPFLNHPELLLDEQALPESLPEPKPGLRGQWSKLTDRFKRNQTDIEAQVEMKNHIEQDEPEPDQPSKRLRRVPKWFRGLFSRKDQGEEAIQQITPDEDEGETLRLLFAHSPQPLPISHTTPHPPGNLTPICFLDIVKSYRPEVKTALEDIQTAGIAYKILSSGQLHNAEGLAKELNYEDDAALAANIISGDSFTALHSSNTIQPILEKSVHYQHSTEQMVQVLDLLRKDGEFVALQTSGISEIPLMAHVDVNITSQGSNQKSISKADVILMNTAPAILPTVFRMGQNIVQSVVNLLKINLTEIGYVLLLIIAMFLTGNREFVYEPVHGGIIAIFSIMLPSVFISFWTNSLRSDRENIQTQLWLYILPASITIALTVVGTLRLYQWMGQPFSQIQQNITHLLVLIGLILIIFCYPPTHWLSGNGIYYSDRRLALVSLVLFTLFNALTFLPLFQRYLRLYPLPSLRDYAIIWGIGLAWALVLWIIWRMGWKLQRVSI